MMPTFETFERTVRLGVDTEEAYAWHARPGAFDRLKPPWQRLEVIEPLPEMANGARTVFRIRQGPVGIRWVADHEEVEPGRGFTDVQTRGPFSYWRHRHGFEPIDETSCLLRDSIRYRLPLGPLGKLAGGAMLRRDLDRMFHFRHALTVGDLETHRRYSRPLERPLRVAITGAGGLIGSALAAFLTTGGHQVIRLVRHRARGPGEAEWDPATGLRDLEPLEGLDSLVHLAGENIAGRRWTKRRKKRLWSSRVESTEQLVESLRKLERPPRVFLAASGLGIYGESGDRPVDESQPPGSGFLAELAAAWEQAASATREICERSVSLRIGIVLSAAGGALAQMLPAFQVGLGGPLGSGHTYWSWISSDDTLGAMLHALTTESVRGAVNLCAPEPVPQAELASCLGRVLRRPTRLRVPAPVLQAALGDFAAEALFRSIRGVPRKLLDSGFEFRHPGLEGALRDGLGIAAP